MDPETPTTDQPATEPISVVDWLRAHTSAWHGWPTCFIFDDDEHKELRRRLYTHGFPWRIPIQTAETRHRKAYRARERGDVDLLDVCDAIAFLRAERRGRYSRAVDAIVNGRDIEANKRQTSAGVETLRRMREGSNAT